MNKPEAKPEKFDLASMDVAQEKRDELKRRLGEAFPEVFAEGAIDFDQLKRVLGEWVDPGKERFGLNWPGKAECMKIIQQPSVATLKPMRGESVDFDTTENLFIEGDNLEVLKLLQKAYFGKVKVVYIDPPYNTGKEFIYPDKYQESLDTYLLYTGQIDGEGKRFATNTDAGGRFHTRWLNMMFPRLYLARNLLAEDGVMFISIDDNEQANLKALCDIVFGEECFIADAVWRSKDNSNNDAKKFSLDHNHTLIYAKSAEWLPVRISDEKKQTHFKNPDNDPNGPYFDGNPLNSPNFRENLVYTLTSPQGIKIEPPKNGWRWSPEVMQEKIESGEIRFTPDGTGIRRRTYLKDMGGLPPSTLWIDLEQTGHNRQAKYELVKLIPEDVFDTPKPVKLLKYILRLATAESGAIVLDFFSGSATTAHAVMDLNIDEGRDLKYIMVQLPEPCEKGSDADKAGYKTIADIARERIRRAGRSIATQRDAALNLEGSARVDTGFRSFKLTSSNFKVWNGELEDVEKVGDQIEMHVDHVSAAATAEDVLFELLLKAGFPLTTKVNAINLSGKDVFSIEDGALLICLEKEITPELIDALADANPLQVICLDEGFKGNDQLKANAVQTFRARAEAEESEIVFKTV
ncbi:MULTISPECIES: site-specific DNA-methyltransferase [unclassified Ensifer]|uniref:site-specific DNA-methyltransferase n=1 Tax=unclassified Ensifer TaxID=2633371 RepID=UPI0007163BE3|nr:MULTISPECIES: site-specific DNA-methyltransferase [unclassified Ensifer]KQX41041.1 hypothetical protein ASD49_15875 [Ensifer sp. Root1298]KQX70362.1 hypothetical protein ASD41_16950 [Ensifer sp. Root1312]KRC14645.1 hypothetical protein ASE29_17430 [Ensifer sp. Root74]KRD57515.1 hypothetical protein ASE71_10845 [Ensifer sp. Root954]